MFRIVALAELWRFTLGAQFTIPIHRTGCHKVGLHRSEIDGYLSSRSPSGARQRLTKYATQIYQQAVKRFALFANRESLDDVLAASAMTIALARGTQV